MSKGSKRPWDHGIIPGSMGLMVYPWYWITISTKERPCAAWSTRAAEHTCLQVHYVYHVAHALSYAPGCHHDLRDLGIMGSSVPSSMPWYHLLTPRRQHEQQRAHVLQSIRTYRYTMCTMPLMLLAMLLGVLDAVRDRGVLRSMGSWDRAIMASWIHGMIHH